MSDLLKCRGCTKRLLAHELARTTCDECERDERARREHRHAQGLAVREIAPRPSMAPEALASELIGAGLVAAHERERIMAAGTVAPEETTARVSFSHLGTPSPVAPLCPFCDTEVVRDLGERWLCQHGCGAVVFDPVWPDAESAA